MRILVTRPEPDGERTAAALRARGCEVLLAPLLRVEPVVDAMLGPGPWAAVALTSANAVRALAGHPRLGELTGLPVFAVGRRTAAAARAAGFTDVTAAEGGGLQGLIPLIRERLGARSGSSGRPILYAAGAERAGDLAGELAAVGLAVDSAVVYRAVVAREFPPAVADALRAGSLDGVLHFSRRSAQAYLDCAEAGGLLEAALAPIQYYLSAAVAEVFARYFTGINRTPARPEEGLLLDLVAPPSAAD